MVLLAAMLAFAGQARADTVVVFAAASLKTALDEIGQAWERATGGRVAMSYAATSALANQIEQGAPADVFLSADRDWMDDLGDRGLIRADTRRDLLGNRLVLVAPADTVPVATIAPGFDLAGLLGDGRLAIADTASVPAGRYGKAALESLGAWDGVADRLAETENVRAALRLVARGEVPLGIVYRTDALADSTVGVVDTFPESSHPPIVYPVAIVADSADPDALAFLEFLVSDAARIVFERHGFIPLF